MSSEIVGFDLRMAEKMTQRGITQADICRLTGLASSMVSHYCTGQRIPSVPAALKIANVLNTTVDYLAYGNRAQEVQRPTNLLAVADENKPYSSDSPFHGDSNSEQALLLEFRKLSTEGKDKVLAYIDDIMSTGKYT